MRTKLYYIPVHAVESDQQTIGMLTQMLHVPIIGTMNNNKTNYYEIVKLPIAHREHIKKSQSAHTYNTSKYKTNRFDLT